MSIVKDINSLDSDTIIKKLQEAAIDFPTDPRPLILLAGEYSQIGATDKAEGAFITALQRSPDYAIARFMLGLLQFTSGRSATAIATWSELSKLPDGNELSLFKRGMEFLAVDNFVESAKLLQSGIKANTSNPSLNNDMQRLLNKVLEQISLSPLPVSTPPLAIDSSMVEMEATAQHILLSNYKNLH
ncbi:tetratricopeptide repeat protein [Undibacterium sp. Ji49W]